MHPGVGVQSLWRSKPSDAFHKRKFAEKGKLPVPVHPHVLRHACGFALADQGADTRLIQDYLGHRNIQHTVRYTATNPARFEKLWR
jgi:type 1 fimbriae regulatory protein FimB